MIQTHIHTETHQPEANRIVADFVSHRIWGQSGLITTCATMGVVRDGILVGGVVFHEYRPEVNTMQLSIAGEPSRWLSRKVINDAMSFAFDAVGVSAIWAAVRYSNDKAMKMDRVIFTHESPVPHLFGAGIKGCIMTLSADEWRSNRLYRPAKKE